MSDLQELKPMDVQLGNFIESMGRVEMVSGIVQQAEDSWFICHHGWGKKSSPLPDDMQYSCYPVPLTEEWKQCLGIDKYELPEWIKYVHEVQNYFRWYFRIELFDIIDWSKLPKTVDTGK